MRRPAYCGRWLAVILLALSATGAHGQCDYDVTVIRYDCDSPPFDSSPTYATALNEHGHVVGYVDYCVIGPQLPFKWTPEDGLRLIELPAGAGRGRAVDVNDDDVIVGTVDYPGLGFRGFSQELGEEMVILPPAGTGGWNQAVAINGNLMVAGTRSIGDTLDPETGYCWNETIGFTDIGVLSGPETHAEDIADDGTVLGWRGTGSTTSIAFLWRHGKTVELGPIPGGFSSLPTEMNSFGLVVGSGRVPMQGSPFGVPRAFKWINGTFTLLPEFDVSESSNATCVNRYGIIAGGAGSAVVWIGDRIIDLNNLIDPGPGRFIDRAVGVNDRGAIVATGTDDGDAVSFVLEPLARPAADISGDCQVDRTDLGFVVRDWMTDNELADINNDGIVDAIDFLAVLAGWSRRP